MSGSASNIFQQYTNPETPVEDSEEQPSYRAFMEARRHVPRLRIHYRDGSIGLLPYAYLVEVLCTSHQQLSLIFTHCVITLEGRHLNQLIDPLQDERIRALHCFNAKEHKLPGEDSPVIKHIARQHPSEVLEGKKK
jgi:hypothetical protein